MAAQTGLNFNWWIDIDRRAGGVTGDRTCRRAPLAPLAGAWWLAVTAAGLSSAGADIATGAERDTLIFELQFATR